MRDKNQSGIALLTTLLILLLISSLLVGFILLVMTDQRLGGINADQTQAFYAAEAGMEKMTADLGTLFDSITAPTGAQLNAIANNPPPLQGLSYTLPGGSPGSGYQLLFPQDANGNPQSVNSTILSGPYQGLLAQITPYTLRVTAHTLNNSEVKLQRTTQTVAIPTFQFGMFSQTDLSFFPGPNFNFGGRVHTNGNLFLAAGSTLTLADRVTAVGDVIRTNLSNGWPTSSNYTGTVNVTTAPGTPAVRALAQNEGSLQGTLGSSPNPNWPGLSIGTYNGNIRNGLTGAKPLNLTIVLLGNLNVAVPPNPPITPYDLIRRPPLTTEGADPAGVLPERFFSSNVGTPEITSLRILLSDDGTDIINLPGVTPTLPLYLGTLNAVNLSLPPNCRAAAGFDHPPAQSSGDATQGYWTVATKDLIGGCLKIEMQNAAGVWNDVTDQIVGYGIAGKRLSPVGCADPSPNAILRFQRIRDTLPTCTSGPPDSATDYWPNVLYDTREGNLRDNIPSTQTTVFLGGVMHYVELDMNNLGQWFSGAGAFAGGTGGNALRVNGGLVVYFSDRRGNLVDPTAGINRKIGEYGFFDIVNPASGSGTPNGTLDTGEDFDGDSILRTYGGIPSAAALANLSNSPPLPPPGGIIPSNLTRPNTPVTTNEARVNRPLFFRRALKLVNGSTINVSPCVGVNCGGLTIASENPVYIQGNYNSNGNFTGNHAAASVIADAVTLLSNSWNDANSFNLPHSKANRTATTSWYRLAIISGKGISFPQPAGTAQDYGTDGGVHNFLRYIENWGGQTLNYRGSIISFYYSRQAVGTYKCCTNVYSPPTRGYNFDVDFLQPNLLPPRTPMFRDVNTTGFTQLLMPTQ